MKDLTTPRFEVIADYPNSPFKVGEILTAYSDTHCKKDGNIVGYEIELTIKPYPNIFRLLKWWEKRSIDDMPEYVKPKTPDNIISSVSWSKVEDNIYGWSMFCHGQPPFNDISDSRGIWLEPEMSNIIPATKEEYEAYINKKGVNDTTGYSTEGTKLCTLEWWCR